jgi:phytoene synthase
MTDDPLKRGTPPGSLRHFAVMFAPAPAQPLLEALYAFEAEIGDTVRASSHEVAHTRLAWWRDEVDRLLGGRPQHPVTRALLPLRARASDRLSLLHEPLVAADIDLACLTLDDAREVEAYCFRATGSVQTLAAIASSEVEAVTGDELAFARRLGVAICRTEHLRDLRADLAAGRLRLPLETISSAGLDPRELRPDAITPAFAGILATVREELQRELQELARLLDRDARARQRQGLVLAALHRRLLGQIDHDRELARTRAEVPAWSKLWTAWSAALRAA